MIKILRLKEVASYLGFKKNQSVKLWCYNNGIQVHAFKGSNKKYILADELDSLLQREFLGDDKKDVKKTYIIRGEHESSFLSILQNI